MRAMVAMNQLSQVEEHVLRFAQDDKLLLSCSVDRFMSTAPSDRSPRSMCDR